MSAADQLSRSQTSQDAKPPAADGNKPHQFSLLRVDGVTELEQRLELVVLGEGDNFHDCPKLTEDLSEDQSGKHRLRSSEEVMGHFYTPKGGNVDQQKWPQAAEDQRLPAAERPG